VPAGLNADLRASTTNGRIDSDFPVLVRGTTNGSIRLREQ
jgi:hypothetical protein